MADAPMIYRKIAAVMSDVGAIGKDRQNIQQKYSFRGIDDVYNAAHPLFVKHGIFSVPRVIKSERSERTTESGKTLLYSIVEMEYTFYAEDGSFVTSSAVGEGMDSGDKATNKAMSAAHKYAIIQLLSIPTAEAKDSEYVSHAVKPASAPMVPTAPEDFPAFEPPAKPVTQYKANTISDECPSCKGRMMISKYPPRDNPNGTPPYYCSKCKKTVSRD